MNWSSSTSTSGCLSASGVHDGDDVPAALHPPREGPCAATPHPLEAEHGAVLLGLYMSLPTNWMPLYLSRSPVSLASSWVTVITSSPSANVSKKMGYSTAAGPPPRCSLPGRFSASSCVHLRARSSMIAALSMTRLLMWAYVSAAAFSGATAARPCSLSPWRLDSPRLDVVRHLGTRGRCLGARPVIQPAAGLEVAGLRLAAVVRTCWQTCRP